MRVLLAIDGSGSSEAARQLVGSLRWPEGTIIEVVAAVEPVVYGLPMTATPAEPKLLPNTMAEEALSAALGYAVAKLKGPGRIVSRAILHGRPATMIVREADTFRAELVVVGSRGLGPLKSMILGSVSAEVVDHAPCPVLVVRQPTIGSVLLAVDGSPSAEAAISYVGGTRFLAGHPVEVLSVAESSTYLPPASLAEPSAWPSASGTATETATRAWAEGIAAAAARTLHADHVPARWSISEGNPPQEIIRAAEDFGCDLIVLGSRGLTGLSRVLLGSVARNVLLHTRASVLIVHEPQRVRSAERIERLEQPPIGQPVATAAR